MKLLYTGPMRLGSLTEARRAALIELGHQVVSLDQTKYLDRRSRFSTKVHNHLVLGPGIQAYNRDILRTTREAGPDLIYVDQGQFLWPQTVADLKKTGARVAHYTSEHFGFRSYVYRHFTRTIPLYDAHVHSFEFSRRWLLERGAQKVVKAEFGYDPKLHRPPTLSADERRELQSDVIFIGHYEPSTASMIHALLAAGIDVKVFGPGWSLRAWGIPNHRQIRSLYGEAYVKRLAAAKICLCFLSKWNKNVMHSASRTFEIPAIGSFLLAERTPDHVTYYAEGKEAEFFSSEKELVDKTKYYLANDEKRREIAMAGHRRCLTSGYSHSDRMKEILDGIEQAQGSLAAS